MICYTRTKNTVKFANILLVYKIFHGLAPALPIGFIKQNQN